MFKLNDSMFYDNLFYLYVVHARFSINSKKLKFEKAHFISNILLVCNLIC